VRVNLNSSFRNETQNKPKMADETPVDDVAAEEEVIEEEVEMSVLDALKEVSHKVSSLN
jgi:hypothetical protein